MKFSDRIKEIIVIVGKSIFTFFFCCLLFFITSCNFTKENEVIMTDNHIEDLLSNPSNLAFSYGGYRYDSRKIQPTIKELKEDLLILASLGVQFIRTYNVHLDQAENILKAIEELKNEKDTFKMYVMLGAWIDCKNAWTDLEPIHQEESERNQLEIDKAVLLSNKYPNTVKVIAVGNEAMVKWATAYYVMPNIILKWVNYLQELKKQNKLPQNIAITSSDNFASWGGGDAEYKIEDLNQLIHAVDFLSVHTYPMHDTHYNPTFWGVLESEQNLTKKQQIDLAMERSVEYAKSQYYSVQKYMKSIGVDKPIHIGETGWASYSQGLYGHNGSLACDEYKQAKYYELMRKWTSEEQITCFYFEAFDEIWKDAENPKGSENHFGLFTVDGKAKLALWHILDEKGFEGLERSGKKIEKTKDGNKDSLWLQVKVPPLKNQLIPQYQTQ